jgi:hypothetical protein
VVNIRDFTYTQLRNLYSELDKAGYSILSFKKYLTEKPPGQQFVILRHDVDRKKDNALKISEIEHEMGICSSYYFRYPYTFDPNLLTKISKMGHEIGYHYEVLAKTRGDQEKAIRLFEKELQAFRKVYDVKTCCAHGSPLSRFDNRELWKMNDFRKFGIYGDAQFSVENLIEFFSDTGRSWDSRNNLRDFVENSTTTAKLSTTEDLIGYIRRVTPQALYISIHPERWTAGGLSWHLQWCADSIYNTGRTIIRSLR